MVSQIFGNGLLQLASISDSWGFKTALLDNNAFRLPIDAIRQEIRGETQPKTFRHQQIEFTVNPDGSLKMATDAFITAIEQGILNRELIDKLREEVKRLKLSKEPWDIIGIGSLITQYKFVKELLPVLREEHPDALIVLGGGGVSSMPYEWMHWLKEADIASIGESYLTWQEIMEHAEDRNWKKIKGLAYREGKKIKLTTPRPLISEEKLDEEVPFPAYELSPVETYLLYSQIPYSQESMQPNCRRLDVLASYGCSWSCNFCFHSCCPTIYGKETLAKLGKSFRQHSPDYVVRLITHLRLTYGINFVSFMDENMTINKAWFYKFCEKLEESGLATLIHWGMVCHTRTVDAQLLQKAKDVGNSYISYGGETSNEDLLKQIGKGQTKETMTAAIEATHAAGINPIMSFIIGFPHTTIDHLINDTQFFLDNQIFVNPFFLQAYPSTQLYKQYKDKIVEQHMTDEEKAFLTKPSVELYYKIFGETVENVIPSISAITRKLPIINDKIRDVALERWVLSLDDATRLSHNLTDFNDVELAGLRYMLNTWDVRRLEQFKKIKEGK